MFEDSLVESSGRLAHRHPWTTAVSFIAQSTLGGIVVLISLLYTDALPVHTLIDTLQAPPPPPPQTAVVSHITRLARQPSEINNGVLIPPRTIAIIHDQREP